MKSLTHILILCFLCLSLDFQGQSTQMISEKEFISICKTISELEVINEAGLIDNHDGEETLFFLGKTEQLNLPATIIRDGY
ncbi:hypothetical protein [Halocola ammonii]